MADTFHDGARRVRAKVYVRDLTKRFTGNYQEPLPEAEREPDGPAMQFGPAVPHFAEVVTFAFVNGNDPDSENAKFWSASPEAAPWSMTIANPGAHGIFHAGEEYYIDFVEAVRTPG